MPAESSVRHEELPSFKDLKSRRGVSPADTAAPSISALALLPALLGQEAAATLRLLSLALPGHCHPVQGHPCSFLMSQAENLGEKKGLVFPLT